MKYADTIKKLRLMMCLNQTEFGQLFSVNFGPVNRWEKGKHLPSMKIKRIMIPYFEKYNIEVEIK